MGRGGLAQGVEDDAREQLGEEIGRLRRHRLGRGRHGADLVDGRGAERKGGVVARRRQGWQPPRRCSACSRLRSWRRCRLWSCRGCPSGRALRGSPRRGSGRPGAVRPGPRRGGRCRAAAAGSPFEVGVHVAEDPTPSLPPGRARRRGPPRGRRAPGGRSRSASCCAGSSARLEIRRWVANTVRPGSSSETSAIRT